MTVGYWEENDLKLNYNFWININMPGIENSSSDLFFKLRNRFPRITMGDENSNATTNPDEARFFNFDYEENEVKFGNITLSLIDRQNLKIYFSQDITKYMDDEEKHHWYKFLKEMRKFAKSHLMGLDVRDITKDFLTHKDLQFVSNQNKEKQSVSESRVDWTRRGKVSEGNLNNVRIHVVHNERMMENPNNRLLRVDRIFLVNESGERFLLPFKSVVGAKAMANHVSRGGNPYDQTGQLISSSINEMVNLRRFGSATRRKTFESEDARQVITAVNAIKESIKRNLQRLANNSRFDESIESLSKLISEQDEVQDIKPLFVQSVYNENLDNWISSAAKAFNHYKGSIMENETSVAEKISNPDWKLILKDDPSEDKLISTSKYDDGQTLMRRILDTIASRLTSEDHDVAQWASDVSNKIESGVGDSEDMKIALQLAHKYKDDLKKMADSEEYKSEVRVNTFDEKSHDISKNTEVDEYEDFVQGIQPGEEKLDEMPSVRAMQNASRSWADSKMHTDRSRGLSMKGFRRPGEPSKDEQRASAKDAIAKYFEKGGRVTKEDDMESMQDEISNDEEGMSSGVVNETDPNSNSLDDKINDLFLTIYDGGDDALDLICDEEQYPVYNKWLENDHELSTLSDEEKQELFEELSDAVDYLGFKDEADSSMSAALYGPRE